MMLFDLQSLLTTSFSWQTALSLAAASKLSYQREPVITDLATKNWGFSSATFFDEEDAQGFVAETDEVVLVAFRGTESLLDWLANIDIALTERPYGEVHRGFFGRFEATRSDVVGRLSGTASPGRKIWLTGHSLGGALATLAASELQGDFDFTGIHTFGQPRVGQNEVRQFIKTHYEQTFFRFVNGNDLVTRLPPGFEHAGTLIRFNERGEVQSPTTEDDAGTIESPPLSETEFETLKQHIKALQREIQRSGSAATEGEVIPSLLGLLPGAEDHAIDRYIAAIRRQLPNHVKRVNEVAELARARSQTESDLVAFGGGDTTSSASAQGLIPVLLRLRQANWQAPAGVKVNSQIGTVVSAQAAADDLSLLNQDSNVLSIEVSRDAGSLELDASIPFIGADQVHRPPLDERGDSVVIGVLDTGVDVLHDAFLDTNGNTRILAIWNQQDDSGPTPMEVDPNIFTQDYGTLYLRAELQSFVDQPDTTPPALRDREAHGTHVASIAAGRAAGTIPDGMAPEAGIIAVMPNMRTEPGMPPSLGYSSSHIDALSFLKRAAAGANPVLQSPLPLAVNVSLGMNAGAHDGTSSLEAAFDQITGKGRDPGIVIVKSAGNERGHGGHTRIRLFNGLSQAKWDSGSQFRFQDYIEAWYSSLDDVEFELRAPDGSSTATVSDSNPQVDAVLGGNRCRLRLTTVHPDNGDNRLTITIEQQPSAIQSGTWELRIVGTQIRSPEAKIDLWVERDRSRAVRFLDDEPEGTLSIPGTADTVISVGACDAAVPVELTDSSSFGRTRDDRTKPDVCAPGKDIKAARANQSNRQASVELTGTSMAAPHVTGALALVLSHRQKQTGKQQFNAVQLQAELVRTAKGYNHVHHEGAGYGTLDAHALYQSMIDRP